ncbi:DUF6221 family protein [Streptomyces sp. WAC 06738]|uniref:DUF6221 family protein n=1 Tax=Streptomyces sp. WAC 06738 TaxID=2203210 RepID=UPI001F0C9D82|nr:DUF6221 family protein [Streptomyces sp. WAC 06738]
MNNGFHEPAHRARDLVAFLRERYAEQRRTAVEQRLQHWQREVAELNAKQAVVDHCERWTLMADEAGRRIAERSAAGLGVEPAEALEAARLDGCATAVIHVVATLALPFQRHPGYREAWRPPPVP